MKQNQILLMFGAAIAGYWLMSRFSGTGQTVQSGMYGRQIILTSGDTIQLNQKDGMIYDAYGGLWT